MTPVIFTGPTGGGDVGDYAPGNTYRIFSSATPQLSGANVDTDVCAFTIPAGTLSAEGDTLKIQLFARSLGADTKTLAVRIGSVSTSTNVTTAATDYNFYMEVIRETTQLRARFYQLVWRTIISHQSGLNIISTLDWDTDQNFVVRLRSVTAGNIELFICTIDLVKAEA